MVIFLPLLFADGQPTNLERITQNQLERFIPFMLSCCPESTSDTPPKWWHPLVPYKFPLISPNSGSEKWLTCLKRIVCRCYEYHKCEHVLRFCYRLAELPPDSLKYKENSQGFISIFNKTNNKLIVTFKKRNQIYDRQNLSPFKTLLPRKPSQPPREQHIEDIYLCNYCDEEFTSGKDIVAHEAICKGKVDESSKNATLDQELFARYFGLCPSNKSPKKQGTPSSKRGTSVRLTPRTYVQIPISSPLGLRMGANICKLRPDDKMEYVCKVEAQCCGKVWDSSQTKHLRRFGGSRFRSFRRKKEEVWAHTYCFSKAQRLEKKLTLKTGLNKRARVLLRKCKRAVVLVERLPLLDPLALHAAASLHYHADALKNDKRDQDKRQDGEIRLRSIEKASIDLKPATVFIDLTCDEGTNHDELSLKENFCNNRSSKDIFLNSSSNHKRPPLQDWSAIHPVSQFILA